jgi:hypothetical protein
MASLDAWISHFVKSVPMSDPPAFVSELSPKNGNVAGVQLMASNSADASRILGTVTG